ncbi:MAG: hypothetical protein COA71_14055 [SAR86 cluster bacterium]|uniref:Uncharacterized protein n=1 Tax=SAR86 cluster bacterium TaxID=2030880 RepID=A0A2A5C7M9_9GAMM|nr:hypothetical protein [Gammaproteobacteria bacterium AH-315-E17]PCJ39386.1 MAG: hypothetical protein COA71_14055 [SAR86 cluster bacterium]
MVDRRKLLKTGVVVPALFTLPTVAFSSVTGNSSSIAHETIAVVDERFIGSALFRQELVKTGADYHAISGDISPLWASLLKDDALQDKAIIGLSSVQSLFALSLMLQPRGFRLIHQFTHTLESESESMQQAVSFAMGALSSRAEILRHQLAPTMKEQQNSAPVSWVLASSRYFQS